MRSISFAAALALGVAVLAVGCNDGAPRFLSLTELTDTTSAVGPYQVVVTVAPGVPLDSVKLSYKIGDEQEVLVEMTSPGGAVWTGAIPGQPAGTTIEYRVIATDVDGTLTVAPVDDAGGHYAFTFNVLPAP